MTTPTHPTTAREALAAVGITNPVVRIVQAG